MDQHQLVSCYYPVLGQQNGLDGWTSWMGGSRTTQQAPVAKHSNINRDDSSTRVDSNALIITYILVGLYAPDLFLGFWLFQILGKTQ